MVRAFGRILLISVLSLSALVLAVVALRQISLRQSSPVYQHRLLKPEVRWIVSEEALSGAALPPETLFILALPLELGPKGWTLTDGSSLTLALQSPAARVVMLEVPKVPLHELDQLLQTLDQNRPQAEDVVVLSRSASMLSYLRSKRPFWVYNIDPSSLVRLNIFAGMYLEPVLTLKGDFAIISRDRRSEFYASPQLEKELRRRGLWLIEYRAGQPDPNWNGVMIQKASTPGS